MGLLQVLLLAAALGWDVASAIPSNKTTESVLVPYSPTLSYITTSATSSYPIALSPATMHTDTTLQGPSGYVTTTLGSLTITAFQSPAAKATQTYLISPVATTSAYAYPLAKATQTYLTGPDGSTTSTSSVLSATVFIAHTEYPGTTLVGPGGSTTWTVYASAHTELPGTTLVGPGGSTTWTVYGSPRVEYTATGLQGPHTTRNAPESPHTTLNPYGVLASFAASVGASSASSQAVSEAENVATLTSSIPPNNPYLTNAPPEPSATYFVGDTPVYAGSTEVAVGGTTYSLAPTGGVLYVNGASKSIPGAAGPSSTSTNEVASQIMNVLDSMSSSVETTAGTSLAGTTASSGFQTSVAGTSGSASTESASSTNVYNGSSTSTSTAARSASQTSGSSTGSSPAEAPSQQTSSSAGTVLLPGLGTCLLGALVALS